jgi:polyisoprenoid-binding protein YceI
MRTLLLAAQLLSSLALAQPGAWSLDHSRSELVVKTRKAGAGAGLAHDHVVRAAKFTGTVGLGEGAEPSSLALDLVVDVLALVADEPSLRARHGLPGTVPDGDRQKVSSSMLGKGQLDAARFPTMRFKVASVSRAGAELDCVGSLTLHGVTKELRFPVTMTADGPRVVGDARVRLKTSDYGVQPFSTALGLVRNEDEVELVVHLVAQRHETHNSSD